MPRPTELPADWPIEISSISQLDLDPDNSRLMLRERLNDQQLVTRLISQEDVLELARSIARNDGLHPHESIVVVKRGRRYLVLEGNRRTAAMRILLDPSILPESQRGRIPGISNFLRTRLQNVRVVIAPNVASAAPLISALHTERGKKPWSAAAKAFHLGRLADQGMTVQQISLSQGLKPGSVRKALLSHRLLGVASSTPGLTKDEKNHLNDPRLKLNPFTRFFGLKRASRILNLSINDNGKLTHEGITSHESKEIIRAIAKDMLLPRAAGESPRFNTRVHEDTIIGHQLATKPNIAKIIRKREEATKQERPKEAERKFREIKIPRAKAIRSPRPQDYFFGLDASLIVNNQALANIVAEIAQFPISDFPAAGIYLQRGVVEGCLMHAFTVRHIRQDFYVKHSHKYGLSDLIEFSKDRKSDLWREPEKVSSILGKWNSQFKWIADQTVHVIMAGNADTARQSASVIRPLVEGILRGDALKV